MFAVVGAMVVAALLVVVLDESVAAAGPVFSGDWFSAAGSLIGGMFKAMFEGAIFRPEAKDLASPT